MTKAESFGNTNVWAGWEEVNVQPAAKYWHPNGTEWKGTKPIQQIRLLRTKTPEYRKRLVVVLHGLALPYKVRSDSYREILKVLFQEERNKKVQEGSNTKALADLLLIDYANGLLADFPQEYVTRGSVADVLSPAIGTEIEQVDARYNYENITLLGHSFGSLLARRVLVDAVEKKSCWSRKASGMIVLAGTNMGFKYQKTEDLIFKILGGLAALLDKACPWLVDLCVYCKIGTLLSCSWRNSPWVMDTRMKWLRHYEGNNKTNKRPFHTLYLCATKDQLVGADDLQMVYQLGDKFCKREIKDAFHGDFLDQPSNGRISVAARLKAPKSLLWEIRKDVKFILEIPGSNSGELPSHGGWEEIVRVSEIHRLNEAGKPEAQQPGKIDQGSVRTVVFLIHGIRDNAEWQEDIDYNLRSLHQRIHAVSRKPDNPVITISQVRYGYFNALQFLFPSERKRAVRAFSDEYLRILSRFPDLQQENIHVYAHSNGTFVFGQALKQYKEIRVNRVLMGGSVLPVNFPWRRLINRRDTGINQQYNAGTIQGLQVNELLNYAANADWPTGLLCRGLSYLPGVDGPLLGVGPGGTDGFRDLCHFRKQEHPKMVKGWNFYLKGGHGATLEPGNNSPLRIAKYLLGDSTDIKQESEDSPLKTEHPPKTEPYSVYFLDEGKDPFSISDAGGAGEDRNSSRLTPYWSMYRGPQGHVLSSLALLLFLCFLFSLLGFLSPLINLFARSDLGIFLDTALQPILHPLLQILNNPLDGLKHLFVCVQGVINQFIPDILKNIFTAVARNLNFKVLITMIVAYLLSRF